MATAALKTSGVADPRQRFIDAAVRLFTRHSFAGTSLQMIADELGVTKAAVYHHFHTREELLSAVIEPLYTQIRAVVQAAEAQRARHARAEEMLTGYIDVAVKYKALMAVLAGDPGVFEALRHQPEYRQVITRQLRLLADVQPGPAGHVHAAVIMAGIAGAVAPGPLDLDDDVLRQHLIETGRRTLGLRAPRRSGAGTTRKEPVVAG